MPQERFDTPVTNLIKKRKEENPEETMLVTLDLLNQKVLLDIKEKFSWFDNLTEFKHKESGYAKKDYITDDFNINSEAAGFGSKTWTSAVIHPVDKILGDDFNYLQLEVVPPTDVIVDALISGEIMVHLKLINKEEMHHRYYKKKEDVVDARFEALKKIFEDAFAEYDNFYVKNAFLRGCKFIFSPHGKTGKNRVEKKEKIISEANNYEALKQVAIDILTEEKTRFRKKSLNTVLLKKLNENELIKTDFFKSSVNLKSARARKEIAVSLKTIS